MAQKKPTLKELRAIIDAWTTHVRRARAAMRQYHPDGAIKSVNKERQVLLRAIKELASYRENERQRKRFNRRFAI